jgi:hypothetical protein
MLRAVLGATSFPLLLLAPLGIAASWSSPDGRKAWLFLGTIIGVSALAMVRLHALSGYCTPRHAMVVGWILVPASAAGLERLIGGLARLARNWSRQLASFDKLETAIRMVILGSCLAVWGPPAMAAIDPGFNGYRQAGEWLASSAQPEEAMIDPKGFSLFYADKPGYTFATLRQGIRDPKVRWVVAHEALIFGPWDYGKSIRILVGDRRPVHIFPAKPARRVSKVYVYDLAQPGERTAGSVDQPVPSRR